MISIGHISLGIKILKKTKKVIESLDYPLEEFLVILTNTNKQINILDNNSRNSKIFTELVKSISNLQGDKNDLNDYDFLLSLDFENEYDYLIAFYNNLEGVGSENY